MLHLSLYLIVEIAVSLSDDFLTTDSSSSIIICYRKNKSFTQNY